MFDASDIALARHLVKRAGTAARAFHIPAAPEVSQFHGNPRVFDNAWNIMNYGAPSLYKAPPPTFMGSLGKMVHGLGGAAGNTLQAATVGHNGQNGMAENLLSGAPIRHAWDMYKNPNYRFQNFAHDVGQDFAAPWRRAWGSEGFQQAREDLGAPGAYAAEQAYPTWSAFKNWWQAPQRP